MIEIDGKKYKITENMGFNHSIGKYCKMVDDNGNEKMIVKSSAWKFWTSGDAWEFWTIKNRFGR